MRYDVGLCLLVAGFIGCSSNGESGDLDMSAPDQGGPGAVVDCGPEGARLTYQRSMDLSGLGMGLAFSSDGKGLGIGGHFRDPNSSLRYDTKLYEVASGQLSKTLDCHNYWAITVA